MEPSSLRAKAHRGTLGATEIARYRPDGDRSRTSRCRRARGGLRMALGSPIETVRPSSSGRANR
jgi:hypothetical protein